MVENKLKYRAIVIGDSMVLPRMEIHYNLTWLSKLVNHYPSIEFIDKSRRASTSERLVSDGAGAGDKIRSADLLEYYSPDLVITQIGITDCAPRLYKKGSMLSNILHLLPNLISKSVIRFLKKYRGRKEKFADVLPEAFRKNWQQFFDRCYSQNVFVICILIGIPAKLFVEKSPYILNAINKYNDILIDLSEKYDNVICVKPFTTEEIESSALDEFHVNAEGHLLLAEKLIKHIDGFLKEKTI